MIALILILLILIIYSVNTMRGGESKDDFPYLHRYESIDKVHERMENLKEYEFRRVSRDFKLKNIDLFEIEKYYLPDEDYFIELTDNQYFTHNLVGDWFTEPCRIRANVINTEPVYDWWQKNKKFIKRKTKDLEEQHEIVYHDGPKYLTNFKPTNLCGLIELFGASSVLDFSAGWGDRLAAVIAKEIDLYIGVDPNPCLHPLYQKMIDILNTGTEIIMIESPFQTAELPDKMVDLVFTSPPYFALEIYSDSPGQSSEYEELDTWYNEFLMVSLHKAWSHLKVGGHMVININDYGFKRYCQRMVKDFSFVLDAEYQGVIIYTKDSMVNPQPMWVWKKTEKLEMSPLAFAEIAPDDSDLLDKVMSSKVANVRPVILADELTPLLFEAKKFNANIILNSDYNPPFMLEPIKSRRKKLTLIQDGVLSGGTKQRGLFDYIVQMMDDYDEFVYAGPSEGFAQIALAYVCWRLDKKATNFIDKRKTSKQTLKAESYGGETHRVSGNLVNVLNSAKKYVEQKERTFLVPFGLHDDLYLQLLENNIALRFEPLNIKRLWLVAGSGTLLKVFAKILPNTYFLVVQVGRRIYEDQLPEGRSKLFIAPEKFHQYPRRRPPYRTVMNYDGKMWQFIEKHAQSGDYVFNVGSI